MSKGRIKGKKMNLNFDASVRYLSGSRAPKLLSNELGIT
jgi:hypothetical protein